MTANADAIEHESDRHRDNVATLIDELRTRLTAGEILDQVLGTAALRGMAGTLAAQARRNPMALALAAGGLAWMMMSERNPAPAAAPAADGDGAFLRAGHDAADTVKGAAQSVRSAVYAATDAVRSAGQSASSTASAVMDSAGQTLDAAKEQGAKARDYAQSATGAANDTVSGMAGQAGNYLRNSKPGARLERLSREQPLLLAGIGFAAGMLLGAGLPMSEIENELLGEQSDQLKAQARETMREGVNRTREAAGAAYEAAMDSLGEEEEEDTASGAGYMPDGSDERPPYH